VVILENTGNENDLTDEGKSWVKFSTDFIDRYEQNNINFYWLSQSFHEMLAQKMFVRGSVLEPTC
jgi:hypothetical protein